MNGILNQLVDAAIEGDYYTCDGERVMLPIKNLIDMGLVDPTSGEKLKQRLNAWMAANPVLTA